MGRTYEIELSCGCLISLDGGGALIDCCKGEKCKFNEEYMNSPKYKEWQEEISRRNGDLK